MPRGAEARVWWAEVEDVKERIEHRRASERRGAAGSTDDRFVERRTVSITGQPSSGMGAARLRLVQSAPASTDAEIVRRHRDRPRLSAVERMGSRPDRVAALAVMLGLMLVLSAVLSAHG